MIRIIGLHYDLHIFLLLNSLLGRMKYHFINKLKVKQVLNQITQTKANQIKVRVYMPNCIIKKVKRFCLKQQMKVFWTFFLDINNLQHKRINMTFKFPIFIWTIEPLLYMHDADVLADTFFSLCQVYNT